MFGLGITEILLILGIIILIFGAKKLPEVGSGLGRAIQNFKKASSESEEIDVTPSKDKDKDKDA
ncbi:twin-arginine translocase TatA/TatE family subunit [Desulfovibrio gilichinskyi]|jgi:sec-independent protein translocase protein TatA|uniref:Sec-independent protein translocase protein TatA n=1 Tax=Desulfovibrio gilichinskyi TaxID=1519643 RepID=A0A1X7C6K4_9BACT|nr:twin-arginine translocase TatA/TatE family subunit [Desulfovibrio gilichinskyi]SME90875.1 sec-independent protein translocase protein TatA [Desulfovibrio gilichinskyi]